MSRRSATLGSILLELALFFSLWELAYRAFQTVPVLGQSLIRSHGVPAYRPETGAWLAAFALAWILVFPVLRRLVGQWKLVDFGLPKEGWGPAARAGVILVMLLLFVANGGFLLIPDMAGQLYSAYGFRSQDDYIVFLVLIVPIAAALGEELLFRCYLQGLLQDVHRSFGPVIAAVVFASMHAFQGLVPLLAFHIPGALLIGAIYRRYRNLPVLIGAHLCFDLVVFAELFVLHGRPELRLPLTGGLVFVAAATVYGLRKDLAILGRELVEMRKGLRVRWPLFTIWALVVGACGFVANDMFEVLGAVGSALSVGTAGAVAGCALTGLVIGTLLTRTAPSSDGP